MQKNEIDLIKTLPTVERDREKKSEMKVEKLGAAQPNPTGMTKLTQLGPTVYLIET